MKIKARLLSENKKVTEKQIIMELQAYDEFIMAKMDEIKTESEYMQAKMERENLFEFLSSLRTLAKLEIAEITMGLETHEFMQPAETEKIKGGY